jgi:hypothetical protein
LQSRITKTAAAPWRRQARSAWVALPAALVTVLATVLAGAASAADPAPSARATKAERLVVSPRPHQRVRTHPLKIVVRHAHDGLHGLKSTLNGHKIAGEFGATRRGRRRASVSSSHGLRHGKNVLRVAVRRPNGKWRRTTVRFRVAHRRPLAGAGRDRRVVVRRGARLRGSAARAPGRVARAVRRINYHWKLIKAPKRSKLGRRAKVSSSAVAARSALSDADARAPAFTPDVPGPYTFKLTTGDGSRSTYDKVTLRSVPPTPLVRTSTLVDERPPGRLIQPGPGIRVGSTVYRGDAAGGDDWLQVVVLDRATLGLVSNKTYSCTYPFNCGPTVANDLKVLDDTKLVIAASHNNYSAPHDIVRALAPIGFPKLSSADVARLESSPGGTVSAIGVPGQPAGQANVNVVPGGQPGEGRMDGYLTPDQFFNFGWLPADRFEFDTRAAGDGSRGTNTMRIAGKDYSVDITGPGAAGVHQVLVFDGRSFDLREQRQFDTNDIDDSEAHINEMTEFLRTKVRAGDVVFISSVVDGERSSALADGASSQSMNKLADTIASLGGTRHVFNTCGPSDTCRYSLVGWGGAGEGSGEETSTQKDSKPGDARLSGALTRDRRSLFKPQNTSITDQPPGALAHLLIQPATAWPLADGPQAQQAIAYIGSQDKRLGADPRSAYWTQPFDQATWDQIADVVSGLKYPGAGHGFSMDDFTAAQKELVQEMTWVGDVRAYLKALSSPFADNAISSWANLQVIADKSKAALKPPDQKYLMLALDVVNGLLDIAGVATAEKTVVAEVIAVVYTVALEYLTQDRGGDSIDEISADANDLAAQLVDRLQSAQASFRGIGNIIVSDYAKLKTVGTLGGCSPSADGCPAEWQFTQRDQQRAAAATSKSIEAEFDRAFMKNAFPSFLLGPHRIHHKVTGAFQPLAVTRDAKDYPCFGQGFYPFQDASDNGQAALLTELPDIYDVYALGNLSTLSLTNNYPQMPPKDVLDRMFGEVSSSLDPRAGGLGLYKPDFMREASKGEYNNALPSFRLYGCGEHPWGPE